MSVNVDNLKEEFSDLKYEQLLSDKYFIETCFSKKFNSYTHINRLKELSDKINMNDDCSEGIKNFDCIIPNCNTTTSTTTTTTIP